MGEKGEKFPNFQSEKEELKIKIEELRNTVEREPENIKAWIDLGELYTRGGEEKKAYDTFKEGLEHNPEAWEIWGEWGNFFMEKGDFCRAYTCFYNALELLKSKKEEIPLNYHFNLVKALSNLPKGDPAINIKKAVLYLRDLYKEKITDSEKKRRIKCIKSSLHIQLASLPNPSAYDLYKEALSCSEEAVKVENLREKMVAWYNKGLVLLFLQEGKPEDWLRESEKSFDNVLKILEILEKEEQIYPETKAKALFYKGLIKKGGSDFNPFTHPAYGDKEKRIKDLEESADYLTHSQEILKELIKQKSASSDNIFFAVEGALGKINKQLKMLKGETPPDYREEKEKPDIRYIY